VAEFCWVKSVIAKLRKTHSLAMIEAGLASHFLRVHQLTSTPNQLLLEVCDGASDEICNELAELRPALSLDDVVSGFELLIPDADRQLNGAFFTPPLISAYLAAEAIRPDTANACDPACGCGAILLACARRLAVLHNETLAQVIATRVFGVDICEYNVRRARVLLNLAAVAENSDQDVLLTPPSCGKPTASMSTGIRSFLTLVEAPLTR
jgi:hypothetical protein